MFRNIRWFSIATLLVVVALVLGACGTPVPTAPPEATPTPPPTATSVPRGDPVGDMILIPAGEFTMGSDGGADDERPPHRVYLDAFYIGRYEVTNAQYGRFVEATGYEAPKHWSGGSIPGGLENFPVVYVSWYDALAYCRWLSEETGQTVRLATEAEWEKAARGTDGAIVSGWEWTSSLYEAYPYDPDDGREDLEADGDRVLRGGAFNNYRPTRIVRCAARSRYDPDSRHTLFGFRVVVSSGSPE